MDSDFNMHGMKIAVYEEYPLAVIVYGSATSQETELVRNRLNELEVPFEEIDVDEDKSAAQYVAHINHGELVIPTIVFGNEDFIIVEPSRNDLDRALSRAGYEY